jgi:hypothetical protein
MAKGGKGQQKRSASNNGNAVIKNHKQSSAESNNDKTKTQAQMERLGMANV